VGRLAIQVEDHGLSFGNFKGDISTGEYGAAFWSNDLITPHPLGGCKMGNSAADGVVHHAGEVFG
jgi:hypothetical protein